MLLFMIGMITSRYVFIFRLKNPAAFQDDFWSFYLNISVVGFSAIAELVLYRMPGRNTIYHYVCTGKPVDVSVTAKKAAHMTYLSLTAILTYILLSLRILLYKRNNKVDPRISANIKLFEKSTIFDLTLSACIVSVASTAIFLTWKVNSIAPVELNIYPNYLFEYFFRLAGPVFFALALAVLYYLRNPHIAPALAPELDCRFR